MSLDIARRSILTAALGVGLVDGIGASAQPTLTPPANADDARLRTDWADLQRYRDDNLRVRALPPAQRRVVFLGDSITEGWSDMHPTFFATNGFVGRGIGGQTTPQMLVRFREDVVALDPAAVHILAGTNDVAENTGPFDPEATKSNIESMAELAKLHGLRVVLGAVPPAADFYWRPGLAPAAKIRALNQWLKAYAGTNGFVFADYTTVLDDGAGGMKVGLSHDGVHPSDAGYRAMEEVALPAITAALHA